jgi:rfaE bifunctional protein kinase chain/domain
MDTSGVAVLAGYPTPVKTRVLAGLPHSRPQQVIRIDRGGEARVDRHSAEAAAERARVLLSGAGLLSGAAGLLLSDYGYDAVTPESAAPLIAAARAAKVPVTCDSRRRGRAYKGVTAITPNLEEAEQLLGARLDDAGVGLEKCGRDMLHMLDCRAVLITRGSHGMTLVEDGVKPFDIPVHGGDQVADVTGAGDTVIAAFTLALAAGATFRLAALLSNIAAGIVVMKRGTAVASAAELQAAIAALPAGTPA